MKYIYEESILIKLKDFTNLHVFYADSVHVFPEDGNVILWYKLDNLSDIEHGKFKFEEYQKMLKLADDVQVLEMLW